MRFYLFLFLLITFSNQSHAQWYESQGHALIVNGDKETARTLAMENALKKALLVAGASVNSVQEVVNGLVTQDELSVRASGTVNSIEIISESQQGDTIEIVVRADIFAQEQQCFAADFKKSMLITRAHLTEREQANIGQIYQLDTALVKALASKLKGDSRFLDIKLAVKNKTPFSRYNNSFAVEKIKALAIELGHRFDTQFVMFTEINDISFGQEALNNWQFWQEDQFNRQLQTSFYLYSAINGELLAQKDYQNSAPWQFGKRDIVDINSQKFWTSQYGNMISRTLDDAIIDIDESMMCQQTRAKIVKVDGNEVMVNVGKQQGVKLGDEFTLLHLNTYKNDFGKTYAGFNVSPYKVKITEVFQHSAVATTPDKGLLGNIQLNDLAVKSEQ